MQDQAPVRTQTTTKGVLVQGPRPAFQGMLIRTHHTCIFLQVWVFFHYLRLGCTARVVNAVTKRRRRHCCMQRVSNFDAIFDAKRSSWPNFVFLKLDAMDDEFTVFKPFKLHVTAYYFYSICFMSSWAQHVISGKCALLFKLAFYTFVA